MECKHWMDELMSCVPMEAGVIPLDQNCKDCPHKKEEEK